jgi:hypothetical protein
MDITLEKKLCGYKQIAIEKVSMQLYRYRNVI